jgi:sugar phosphate isomerase/epimerase
MVKLAGYDGVEMGFPYDMEEVEKYEILAGFKEYKLEFIGQHFQTIEHDFESHICTFEKHLFSICSGRPLFINSQTGKDYFSKIQNLKLINRAHEISEETGVKIIHETHRGRWSFAAHVTKQYLIEYPEIKLTFDISHWCNVAESLLIDQMEAVELAIKHADHIHARVGFQEGPQINDPRAPEWKEVLNTHLNWWDRIYNLRRQNGFNILTVTPEFGAPPYLPLLPYTQQPVVNQWDLNVYMMNLLKERWEL